MPELTKRELLDENRRRFARGEKLLPVEKPKDSFPLGNEKKETETAAPKRNVIKEKETNVNVPEHNEEKEKKKPIFDEEKNRNFKPKNHNEEVANNTAIEYDDVRSLGNYLKIMKLLGLSNFERVKAYVDDQEGVISKGKYFTYMAKLKPSSWKIKKFDNEGENEDN